jgi:serine/threonine-protein kinase
MTGRVVSHYEILEKLGEGGMGVVFKARDRRLDRLVAVKVLPERLITSEGQVARFEQEARAVAALQHPHIATLHDIGEAGGERFLVLEYLPGGTLKAKLRAQSLSIPEVLRYGQHLAEALAHAHRRGIVHRDVKSDNAMFTAEGILKLTDFGLAKLAGAADLTQTGYTVGTAAYMSPEQAQGAGVDHRSDIFSFGIVLYEMAAGQLPFRGEHAVGLLYEIVHTATPSLLQRRPDAPVGLEDLLLRVLEKDREHRYQSMEDVARDLRELEAGGKTSSSFRTRALPGAIAVLPFANLSPDPENEYFSDGLTEDLISALSQLEGLRVVARTSAFQFKGQAQDVRKIGRRLNAGAILEGSVRRAGDKVRVTAQLVHVADGFQLWSERYDREMRDVFAIQDEICAAIVKALRVKLAGEGERPRVRNYTENLDAYHHLLKGRYYWNQWTEEGFRRGIEHYSLAIAAAPTYAPAYAGLADCCCLLGFWGLARPSEVMPQSKGLALKAVQLDENLPEAHCSLGLVLALHDWDWSAAEREFRRAIQLNPGSAAAHALFSIAMLTPVGRFEEAIAGLRRAVELDPLSLVNITYLGAAHWVAGDSEEAIRHYRRALELDANFGEAWRCLGWAYVAPPRLDQAIPAFEKARALAPTPIALGDLAYAYARAGRIAEARALMAQLEQFSGSMYVPAFCFVLIHFGLGDPDAAFRWLERAYQERSSWLMWLKTGPAVREYQDDPRLIAIREKIFGSE